MCGGCVVDVVGAVLAGTAGACVVAAGAETPLAAEDDSAGGVRGWVAGAEPWFGLGEAIVNGRAEMQDRKARL